MIPETVALTEFDLIVGGLTGVTRAAAVIVNGWRNRADGLDDDGRIWTRHVEGALAEMAVAYALDRSWSGGNRKFKCGDVGELQVRARIGDHRERGLPGIVQPRDRDEDVFVFVVGRAPTYRLVGWLRASEAKAHDEWKANPGNYGEAWFVPQADTHAIDYLEDVITSRHAA